MLINHRKQWVFLHNPKCAGTSVRHWLKQHWPDEWVTCPDPLNSSYSVIAKQMIQNQHQWDAGLTCRAYRKFCIVRDPLARFASWWRFATQFGIFPDMEFNDFALEYGESLPLQKLYVEKCQYVIRYEQMDIGLMSLPWATSKTVDQFPHENHTMNRPVAWNVNILRHLMKIYWSDYVACGYPPVVAIREGF